MIRRRKRAEDEPVRGISRRAFSFGLAGMGGLAALPLGLARVPEAARADSTSGAATVDLAQDTWVATDGLGRPLPTFAEVGGPRADRFVGLFYFAWLGQHTNSGPWNISTIVADNPLAVNDSNHSAWGPLLDFHHWGEPALGYYRSTDPWVIRKHAEMLADAGVDTIVLDVTNQHTYQRVYHAILEEFAAVRQLGETTPSVMFIAPFHDPKQVVIDLYYDLYRGGAHADKLFVWDSKPLIMADPARLQAGAGRVELVNGGGDPSALTGQATQGQTFTVDSPIGAVGCRMPTWSSTASGATLKLRKDGPTGPVIAEKAFTNIVDNEPTMIVLPAPMLVGTYYLEQSQPVGQVGWWSHTTDQYSGGTAYANGAAVAVDRSLIVDYRTIIDRVTVIDTAATRTPVSVGQGTLGQTFKLDYPVFALGAEVATWYATTSSARLSLYQGGPGGALVKQQSFFDIADNSVVSLQFDTALAPGQYYLEVSNANGPIAWWSARQDCYPFGQAHQNGNVVVGDRSIYSRPAVGSIEEIRDFFSFRGPDPFYHTNPTGAGQWGWLQDHPQTPFYKNGVVEQVTVSVAQNIVDGRGGGMSEPRAQGRSFHNETLPVNNSQTPYGLNFQEQWDRALQLDPRFVFITGWNEWVATRFSRANNPIPVIEGEVIFVDNFDEERSRDIEPMRGGHGDDYYYQMVANIRRYKGVRAVPSTSAPKTIGIDGVFSDWSDVAPSFRDHRGDTVQRLHPNWRGDGDLANNTGRNEILETKVARDASNIYFYARTAAPMTPYSDPNWMMLLIKAGEAPNPSWEGFTHVINRSVFSTQQTTVQRSTGGWNWQSAGTATYRVSGNELEISVPRSTLALGGDFTIDFKWIDNMQTLGDIQDAVSNGDAAPSGRFCYRYSG